MRSRASDGVAYACRLISYTLRLRQKRSTYTLSIHRPFPSIEMRTPCSLSTPVNASDVNCDPWFV